MESENQTPDVQPDYGFITNQPDAPKKPKLNKKLLVIGILGFVVVILGLSTFFLAENDPEPTQGNPSSSQKLSETESIVKDVVEKISTGTYTKESLGLASKSFEDAESLKTVTEPLHNVDTKNCTYETSQEELGGFYKVIADCGTSGTTTKRFIFGVGNAEGRLRVMLIQELA